MTGYRIARLTAMAIAAARRVDPEIEYKLHRGAHRKVTESPESIEDMECFVCIGSCDIGEARADFHLRIGRGGNARIEARISCDEWIITDEGVMVFGVPASQAVALSNLAPETLGRAGILKDDPWADLRYTECTRTDDILDSIRLIIPELTQDVGSFGHDGLRTWSGEWQKS